MTTSPDNKSVPLIEWLSSFEIISRITGPGSLRYGLQQKMSPVSHLLHGNFLKAGAGVVPHFVFKMT
jgi:hypothetical protein